MPWGNKTHTFIVRLWCEPREIEGATPEWRGSIEFVPSGERQFVQNLAQITEIIEASLKKRQGGDT